MKRYAYFILIFITLFVPGKAMANSLPSDEAVRSSLITFGLSSYQGLDQGLVTRQATLSENFKNAAMVLNHPIVAAREKIKAFLVEFHLKAPEKKIDSFRTLHTAFKDHIFSLKKAFEITYQWNVPPYSAEIASLQTATKALLGEYLVEFYKDFDHTQTTYYLDPGFSDQLINEARAELSSLDPSRNLCPKGYAILDAMNHNLKTFTSLPSWVQTLIRNTMAKKIKK